MTLLSAQPARLGHATFLHEEACDVVLQQKLPIEICLSSNLLCKTAEDLETHHINYWLENGLPLAISVSELRGLNSPTWPMNEFLYFSTDRLMTPWSFGIHCWKSTRCLWPCHPSGLASPVPLFQSSQK